MRLVLIACSVFKPELTELLLTYKNIVSCEYFSMAQHDNPLQMKKNLQMLIDKHQETSCYDAIALLCGLCGRGTDGLYSKLLPLVLPCAHDCREILVGSRKRCKELGLHKSGMFTLSAGWCDTSERNPEQIYWDNSREQLIKRFGYEDGNYLYEQIIVNNIRSICYLKKLDDAEKVRLERAATVANALQVQLTVENKDQRWLQKLLLGEWNEKEFIVKQPGERVKQFEFID